MVVATPGAGGGLGVGECVGGEGEERGRSCDCADCCGRCVERPSVFKCCNHKSVVGGWLMTFGYDTLGQGGEQRRHFQWTFYDV